MRRTLLIAQTGLTALLLHPLRSVVTAASVIVVLVPYLVGLGVSRGIEQQAELSIQSGGDLYVTGQRFGRSAPLPREAAESIRSTDGVTHVLPRIVGLVPLGKQRQTAIVVGIPLQELPETVTCVQGRLPAESSLNELVVGSQLAQRLNLQVGSLIPPFYRNPRGERVSKVVGIFESGAGPWQANLAFTSLETAEAIFDQPGWITDLVVDCRPNSAPNVARILRRLSFAPAEPGAPPIRPRVVTREALESLLPRSLLHREGIFNLHFVLLFIVGILVILVTSGFGLSGRRREIGILKATGWQTDEILLRSLAESFLLSVTAASVSTVAAFIWLKFFNGFGIAAILMSGVDIAPALRVPFRLSAFAALLALVISLVLIMTGSLYSSWRAAIVPPLEAMR